MSTLDKSFEAFLRKQAREILENVPAIRDGGTDAVHDARVATRRLRAVLTVCQSSPEAADELRKLAKRLGRRLGKVRDLDVTDELLQETQQRVATEGSTQLRLALAEDRKAARRQLVKALDSLPLWMLDSPALDHKKTRTGNGRRAAMQLKKRIRQQSSDLAKAIDEAPGVYFPTRTHNVRIQAKRLRYLIELAGTAGLWHADDELKLLRDVQSLLGDIHDREVLIDRLRAATEPGPASPVGNLLIAEREALFREYLAAREDLRDVANAGRALASAHGSWRRTVLTVATLSAPVLALATQRVMRKRFG